MSAGKNRVFAILAALCACVSAFGVLAPVAGATGAKPAFSIRSIVSPGNLPPEDTSGTLLYIVIVKNIGSAPTEGPVTITDHLPAGVSYDPGSSQVLGLAGDGGGEGQASVCEAGPPLSCTTPTSPIKSGPFVLLGPVVQPGGELVMTIPVKTEAGAGDPGGVAVNKAVVEGGGAEAVATAESTPISAEVPPFGFQTVGAALTDAEGGAVTQAGAHPYDLDLGFSLNTIAGSGSLPAGSLRDVRTVLPRGVVLNPLATPVRCTEAQLESNNAESDGCPNASAIGIAHLTLSLNSLTPGLSTPLFNMVPQHGSPAELAFDYATVGVEVLVHIQGGLNVEGRYELMGRSEDITQLGNALGAEVDIWGSPSDPSHDRRRGGCAYQKSAGLERSCPLGGDETSTVPALTMPSACSGPLASIFAVDSWQAPGDFVEEASQSTDAAGNPVGVTDCGALSFEPSFTATPTTGAADSSSGLEADLKVPQDEEPQDLATSNLKKAVVTLPEGLVVNPAAANGLQACSEEQVGYEGSGEEGPRFSGGHPSCPGASKLGTVEVLTPLLESPLPGAVYLAAQHANPFGSLLALYLIVDDPKTGVLVKLAGEVRPDPSTGRLTATFDDNPELPFEEFKLDFFAGPQGSLRTPSLCGSYATTAQLSPWSGGPAVDSVSSFQVAQAAGGGACASTEAALPNKPSFEAGTTAPLAGVFSPFVFKLAREDGSQQFKAINVTLPLGLVGRIAGVEKCSQAQIEAAEHRDHEGEGKLEQEHPSCPAGSELGTVTVSAGAGPSPYYVTGRAYLAGAYEGAPFSAVVITPAVAGPFDLGTVVVRAALYINPETAQVTVKSDAFPTIIDGIPLDLRSVAVDVSRNQFMFNPTSCEAMAITGELVSSTGQVAPLSNHFQVGGCQNLPFKPAFKVSTSAKTSKANGASFDVKLTPPAQGPQNAGHEEANIHYVKVELPKQLPSRLTTLQKACTLAQFNANPAGCPVASRVGVATVHTPVLANPLVGPAYFVSHGSEAFPQLDIVLQGEGITVELAGNTFISKTGITSSTFKSVPDVPFTSFELNLPQGPYSALTANTSLCSKPLTMPTEFIGQNGAQFKQNTAIEVEGCPNALSFTHKIKKKTLTLSVYVPVAGKITAAGKGLSTKAKTAKGRETLTLTLKQKKAGKLKTTVKVAFTPSTGKDRKKQTKSAKLKFNK